MTEPGTLNLSWAQLIIEELRRHGVEHFGVAPGSRSSPLALAVARNKHLKSTVHFDERGLAFHAVGYMRGTGKPAAIICTSGTAVANFFPAVIEAAMDSLPLVLLTADRPPELRNCGANQTIDQLRIYGGYVRYFAEFPCPDTAVDPTRLLTYIDEAMHAALGVQPGPVHLNCPFREPLVPDDLDHLPYLPSVTNWYESDTPYTSRPTFAATPEKSALSELVDRVSHAKRGLLVVGRLTSESERQAVAQAGLKLDWPVLSDITSGLRPSEKSLLHGAHDLVLKSEHFRSLSHPDFILHFGGQLVSKHLVAFLSERRGVEYWTCPGSTRTFDPAHAVTRQLPGDLADIVRALSVSDTSATDPNYRHLYETAFSTIENTVATFCDQNPTLTEITLARLLAQSCQGANFFFASSLTIRDFDWFAPRSGRVGAIAANRGASGIDGTVASAVGFGEGLGAPVTLVLGDLALLHDLNSLVLAAESCRPLTIIVVNNQGGRIFEMLPVAAHRDYFERYFASAHSLTFEHAAAMFGLAYTRLEESETLLDAWRTAQISGTSQIIEAAVEPKAAAETRQELFALIDRKLNEL